MKLKKKKLKKGRRKKQANPDKYLKIATCEILDPSLIKKLNSQQI
jgi:hypothetical protein